MCVLARLNNRGKASDDTFHGVRVARDVLLPEANLRAAHHRNSPVSGLNSPPVTTVG